MSALALYSTLPDADRASIERAVIAAHGLSLDTPDDGAPALTLADVVDHDDAPVLVTALREWWHSASTNSILAGIDASAYPRARELAIVLCAESCAHLTTDPRVAECRRVRLAWARGEADDAASGAARDAARDAAWGAARGAAWAAARDAARDAARAALAAPLRTLYPDPCHIAADAGISRWDVAVAEARAALRAVVS